MTAFEQRKTCWIRAKVKLSVTRYPLYYVVCANCGITVEAGMDWDVDCSGCEVLSAMEIRLELPVTLNDGNTAMRSTIKSPDAEKLIPFTTPEGQSVIDDISIAMDNTEVVCFVKYYDTTINDTMLRRYVILKTYTVEEITTFAADKTKESSDPLNLDPKVLEAVYDGKQLFSPDSAIANDSETQFFTPTTRKTLEEVSQTCVQPSSSSSHSPAAKRSINFGTITTEDLGDVGLEIPDPNPTDILESPKKKNKGKGKNI